MRPLYDNSRDDPLRDMIEGLMDAANLSEELREDVRLRLHALIYAEIMEGKAAVRNEAEENIERNLQQKLLQAPPVDFEGAYEKIDEFQRRIDALDGKRISVRGRPRRVSPVVPLLFFGSAITLIAAVYGLIMFLGFWGFLILAGCGIASFIAFVIKEARG